MQNRAGTAKEPTSAVESIISDERKRKEMCEYCCYRKKNQFKAGTSWLFSLAKEQQDQYEGTVTNDLWKQRDPGEVANSGNFSEGRIEHQTDVRNMEEAQRSEDESFPMLIA